MDEKKQVAEGQVEGGHPRAPREENHKVVFVRALVLKCTGPLEADGCARVQTVRNHAHVHLLSLPSLPSRRPMRLVVCGMWRAPLEEPVQCSASMTRDPPSRICDLLICALKMLANLLANRRTVWSLQFSRRRRRRA